MIKSQLTVTSRYGRTTWLFTPANETLPIVVEWLQEDPNLPKDDTRE